MNILILSNKEDAHAIHLNLALQKEGATVYYLDASFFPSKIKLSWQPENQIGSLILPEGIKLEFSQIKSIFWRNLTDISIPKLTDFYQENIAINDSISTLRCFIKACPARWINSWDAYQFHKEKPLQLSIVKQLGVSIPQTLISNDPETIIQFNHSLKQAIFKPVYGGAYTKLVTPEHLEKERLNLALKISPVTIQEYIEGKDIRSYVINNSVYSAQIKSNSLDFREDQEAQLIPLELPKNIKQQCLKITKALKLEWTAIDWRLKTTGEYVFLEANPSPMFLHFEQQTGFPITQELVKLLMQ